MYTKIRVVYIHTDTYSHVWISGRSSELMACIRDTKKYLSVSSTYVEIISQCQHELAADVSGIFGHLRGNVQLINTTMLETSWSLIYTYIYIYIYIYICRNTFMYMYLYVDVYVCMCVHLCLCIYAWIHRHIHTLAIWALFRLPSIRNESRKT
jgi:hypothetical protein